MSIYPEFQGALSPAGLWASPGEDEDRFRRWAGLGPNDPLPSMPVPTDGPIDVGTAAQDATIDVGKPGRDINRPGFFERIQNRPGGSEALLAFGANLLMEPNFFAGLGKGALAYQGALNAERDRLSPQLTRDQQFAYRRNPVTGEFEFEETAAGRRALDIAREKLDSSERNTRYRADSSSDASRYKVDKQDAFKRDELPYRDRWNRADNDASIRAAELQGQFGIQRARISAAGQGGKPPPAGILKQFDEHQGKASAADGVLAQGEQILDLFDNGTLDLNLMNNLRAKGSQATGIGANETTRAYAQLEQFAQQLVNGILLDAKGVQTDGDAVRARIMSMVSSGDDEGARREIQNAMRMLERGRDYASARAEDISRQYGIDNSSTSAVRSSSPAPRPSARPAAPKPRAGASGGVKWRITN